MTNVSEVCIPNESEFLNRIAVDEAEHVLEVIIEDIFLFNFAFGGRRNVFVFFGLERVTNIKQTCFGRNGRRLLSHHFRAVVLFRIVRSGNHDAARVLIRRTHGVVKHVGGDSADVDDVNAGINKAGCQRIA